MDFFTGLGKRRGVVVTSTSLCYHVTQYVTSKEFFDELEWLLKAIDPIYVADAITRVGLRYVDAILPTDDRNIFDYINPSMTGFSLGDSKQRHVQTVVEHPKSNGGIAVRFLALDIPMYL